MLRRVPTNVAAEHAPYDSEEYWAAPRPDDHNHLGLFADGPQPAPSSLALLVGTQESPFTPLPPTTARAQQELARDRARRQLEERQALEDKVVKSAQRELARALTCRTSRKSRGQQVRLSRQLAARA